MLETLYDLVQSAANLYVSEVKFFIKFFKNLIGLNLQLIYKPMSLTTTQIAVTINLFKTADLTDKSEGF